MGRKWKSYNIQQELEGIGAVLKGQEPLQFWQQG